MGLHDFDGWCGISLSASPALVDGWHAILADHDAVPDVRNHRVGRTAETGAMHFDPKPWIFSAGKW
jgi:hypothetical protein